MLSFPNCKINLGLYITGKREDGFHNLETVFYPVPVKDALEIVQTLETSTPVQFSNSGIIAEANTENNICVKAYYLLKKDFPQLPSVKMHLHLQNQLSIGAGLGRRFDRIASFTLKLLNDKFRLGITDSQYEDCNICFTIRKRLPFFYRQQTLHSNWPWRNSGRNKPKPICLSTSCGEPRNPYKHRS